MLNYINIDHDLSEGHLAPPSQCVTASAAAAPQPPHQDWRQAVPLEVEQPFGEGGGGGLNSALVAGVDLSGKIPSVIRSK